ncbi:hypothetical protein EXIGLDRAFT_616178 [Exidia glandulosa HHB12029]|uniref:Reverse transcriptase zinc-binding domain-containing protein n=1 Tax=Exidia glandulosa HHB12029 TaxID=1314781 RepID=A0A165GUC4_EXIGL|nr:hypothetical protein EXIGLDRAFT_616178 [Exidia glandulosa HHB12029]
MPDTDDPLLDHLSEVQISFIRSLLGVHKRSVLAPLYTETGLAPLKYRRIDIALRYLQYAVECAPDTYVADAIADSIALAASNAQSWFMDLQLVILKLRGPFALSSGRDAATQDIELLRSRIEAHMGQEFSLELRNNKKLYLLLDRKGPACAMRGYLKILNGQHREALTRLLLSCHTLAVERLRWVERYRDYVPYAERTCRLCKTEVETPEHVLLVCPADDDITSLRGTYLERMAEVHDALPEWMADGDATAYLRHLLSLDISIALTAEWIYDTMLLIDRQPMLVPAAYIRRY